jgi:hypothetical protein
MYDAFSELASLVRMTRFSKLATFNICFAQSPGKAVSLRTVLEVWSAIVSEWPFMSLDGNVYK